MKPKTKLGQLSRGRRNKNTFDLNQNLKQFNVAAVMTLINSEFEAVVCGCLALSALSETAECRRRRNLSSSSFNLVD